LSIMTCSSARSRSMMLLPRPVRTMARAAAGSPARRSSMVSRSSESFSRTSGVTSAIRSRCKGLSAVRSRRVSTSAARVPARSKGSRYSGCPVKRYPRWPVSASLIPDRILSICSRTRMVWVTRAAAAACLSVERLASTAIVTTARMAEAKPAISNVEVARCVRGAAWGDGESSMPGPRFRQVRVAPRHPQADWSSLRNRNQCSWDRRAAPGGRHMGRRAFELEDAGCLEQAPGAAGRGLRAPFIDRGRDRRVRDRRQDPARRREHRRGRGHGRGRVGRGEPWPAPRSRTARSRGSAPCRRRARDSS